MGLILLASADFVRILDVEFLSQVQEQ